MITVPVINEKDFADSIQGEKIWLEALNFDIDFEYNPYALKFIEARNFTSGELNTTYDPGMIRLSFKDTDSLEAGTIAEMDFTIVIPDTVRTSITLHTGEFSTDSILFLDIQPYGDSGFFNSEGKCNLTYFKFTGESSQLRGNSPNPWSESTKIEFSLGEKVRPVLSIYSRDGRLIDMPLDGTTELEPGRYNVELSGRDYQSGVYYYVLEAGLYRDKGIMSVIR